MINVTQKRKNLRINTSTVAKIMYNNSTHYGMIKNISAGGVKLEMDTKKFKNGDILEIYFRYKSTFYSTYGIIVRDHSENVPYGVKLIFHDKTHKDSINKQILEDYFSMPNKLSY